MRGASAALSLSTSCRHRQPRFCRFCCPSAAARCPCSMRAELRVPSPPPLLLPPLALLASSTAPRSTASLLACRADDGAASGDELSTLFFFSSDGDEEDADDVSLPLTTARWPTEPTPLSLPCKLLSERVRCGALAPSAPAMDAARSRRALDFGVARVGTAGKATLTASAALLSDVECERERDVPRAAEFALCKCFALASPLSLLFSAPLLLCRAFDSRRAAAFPSLSLALATSALRFVLALLAMLLLAFARVLDDLLIVIVAAAAVAAALSPLAFFFRFSAAPFELPAELFKLCAAASAFASRSSLSKRSCSDAASRAAFACAFALAARFRSFHALSASRKSARSSCETLTKRSCTAE